MKIHKKGYTLAEVLITLALVSIVAALTVPQIAGNTERRKNAAMFGKIYQTIEARAKQFLLKYNAEHGTVVSNIIPTSELDHNWNWQQELLGREYGLDMIPIPGDNDTYTMNNVIGEFRLAFPAVVGANSFAATTRIMNITVDVNGFNRNPNQNGIDQFVLFMTNEGKLRTDDDATRTVINNGFKIE